MDKKQGKRVYKFGLIGKDIEYSFSRAYFKKKFEAEGLLHTYENFDLKTIDVFPQIIKNTEHLKGLNVTIPYKEAVIPFLDKLNKKAKKIGAVNTIKITKKGKLIGYNTDCYGFQKSIKPFLKPHHKKALILGTGGASKAIAFTLKKLNIEHSYVSRQKSKKDEFSYDDLDETIVSNHQIIINCTPLGTYPNINECPDIPYDGITNQHLLFDLIYNPEQTKFLTLGKLKGATICNGHKMLEFQAEKAWEIWN
ncbi:MAG: shikimate dehydrogenase [Flavobacteriaceae bacterium]